MTRSYPAIVVRVIDGDTLVLRVDVGFRSSYEDTFRIAHINAPEGKKNPSAEFLRSLLPAGKQVTVTTTKPEKFGRWLCDIALDDCKSVAELMVAENLAQPYEGGKR